MGNPSCEVHRKQHPRPCGVARGAGEMKCPQVRRDSRAPRASPRGSAARCQSSHQSQLKTKLRSSLWFYDERWHKNIEILNTFSVP